MMRCAPLILVATSIAHLCGFQQQYQYQPQPMEHQYQPQPQYQYAQQVLQTACARRGCMNELLIKNEGH